MSTPFFADILLTLKFGARVLWTPANPVTDFSILFFVAIDVLGREWEIQNIRREKYVYNVNGLAGIHRTRVQTIRIYVQQNGGDILTFVRESCGICIVVL